VGKVALIPQQKQGVWLANQSFQIVRLRTNTHISDPVVLFRYLNSPAVQGLLASFSGGSGVKMIQTRDVRGLQILIPSPAEQIAIAEEHQKIVALHAEIARLQAEAKKISESRWSI